MIGKAPSAAELASSAAAEAGNLQDNYGQSGLALTPPARLLPCFKFVPFSVSFLASPAAALMAMSCAENLQERRDVYAKSQNYCGNYGRAMC